MTQPLAHRRGLSAQTHNLLWLTAVLRTSFFPSSSAGNPALTAIANALRVGDHLLERLGAPSARSGATNGKLERSGTTLQPHITDAQESTP